MSFHARLLPALILAGALGAAAAPAAQAALACVEHGGLGGTGAPQPHAGGGGTGAPALDGGLGGTGSPARNGGIGGTGAPQAQLPGGMGGTGAPSSEEGTGIVGTITGFASICVNGVEVHFEARIPVTENGVSVDTTRLAVGQVVAVEAGSSSRGLEARRIAILHAYEGPLSALPRDGAPMRVMGQPVRLAPDARVAEGLQPGDAVRVSGLRDGAGEVVATRIERAPTLETASAIGAITPAGDLQGLALRGAALAPRDEALVRGRWGGEALEVDRIDPDPSIPFAGSVRHAVVEGLVHQREDGHVTLGGFAVTLAADTRFDGGGADEVATGRRVRVSGEFTDSRAVAAARVEIVRPGGAPGVEGGRRPDRDDGRGEPDPQAGRESDERIETVARPERVEKLERVEKVEKVEKVERVEKIERVEMVERIERVERVERPEKD